MSVLIAPAHRSLNYEKYDSEALSVYLILKRLHEYNISYTAIIGTTLMLHLHRRNQIFFHKKYSNW